MPIEGNIDKVFHIYEYQDKLNNIEMVFDTSNTVIYEVDSNKNDWTSIEFGHLKVEVLSGNIPKPRGLGLLCGQRYILTMLPTQQIVGKGLFLFCFLILHQYIECPRNKLVWITVYLFQIL